MFGFTYVYTQTEHTTQGLVHSHVVWYTEDSSSLQMRYQINWVIF